MPTSLREALAAKVREVPFQFGQAAFEGEEAEPIPQAIYHAALGAAAQLIAESPELAKADRLQAEVESVYSLNEKVATVNQEQAAELTALRAEVERLRVDAERYRFWRDRYPQTFAPTDLTPADVDRLTDNAMAQAAKPEPEKTK